MVNVVAYANATSSHERCCYCQKFWASRTARQGVVMRVGITQSFLTALSLFGVLALPSAASAYDEGYYGNRGGVQQGFYNSPYTNREHLRLQRPLRRNYRNYYDRYSYNNGHFGNRWYGERRHYGNRYDQGKNCRLSRRSYGNDTRYRPRYYGNDYYGYAR